MALLGATSSRDPGKPAGARPQVGVGGRTPRRSRERGLPRRGRERGLPWGAGCFPPLGPGLLGAAFARLAVTSAVSLQLREGRLGHLGPGQPCAVPATAR